MKRKWLGLAFFACVATGLFAAEHKIEKIVIRANDNYGVDPTEAALGHCSLNKHVGEMMEEQAIQEAISDDIRALLDTPIYASAEAHIAVNEADAWIVIYTITRRAQLAADPAIMGLQGEVRESKVRRALEGDSAKRQKAIAKLSPIDDVIASEGANRIREVLAKDGFVDGEVKYELRYSDEAGYAFLTYIITAKNERKIDAYCFDGNVTFDDDTLARTFGWLPFYNPISWFTDFPTSDTQLETARLQVEQHYIDAGFLDVKVAEPVLEVVEEEESRVRYNVRFNITEGEQYSVGKIAVQGANIFPQDVLEFAGQQALTATNSSIASKNHLSAVREAIEDVYGDAGYVDTYAIPTMVPRENEAVVDIAYKLQEGERVRITAIDIKGNQTTQDKVIRREITLTPGEYYNASLVKMSEARLNNLTYFERDTGVTSYTLKNPNTPGERRLVFEVIEADTRTLGASVGISTVDSVFVAGRIVERNFDLFNPGSGFKGGGQRAEASAEFGSRRQTVLVGWTQPWLMDMPLALRIQAYRRMRWRDHYDEVRTGMDYELSWKPQPIATPFGEYQLDRIGLRYTLEKVGYEDEDDDVWFRRDGSAFSFKDEEDGINSKLRFFWSENHLNRSFIPTEGWRSNVYAEVGLAGDAKDYGFGLSATRYWTTWWDHVFMGRVRFDTIEAYSGDVPMFDRFFLGGPRTVRGFEFRDGGPKAWNDKDHVGIGGQSMWCATAEYTIPLASILRFAVFSDIGSAGEDFCDFGDDLLWSAGVGLRLDFEQFPIRIDFAKPITNDDDTEEEVFLFTLGDF